MSTRIVPTSPRSRRFTVGRPQPADAATSTRRNPRATRTRAACEIIRRSRSARAARHAQAPAPAHPATGAGNATTRPPRSPTPLSPLAPPKRPRSRPTPPADAASRSKPASPTAGDAAQSAGARSRDARRPHPPDLYAHPRGAECNSTGDGASRGVCPRRVHAVSTHARAPRGGDPTPSTPAIPHTCGASPVPLPFPLQFRKLARGGARAANLRGGGERVPRARPGGRGAARVP